MSTEIKNDYYEILELTENASQHDIYLAYDKAKKTYSAENSALHSIFSTEEAAALRKLIDEAYEVLSNQDYRNIYEKRKLSENFNDEDLSLKAIKEASDNFFQRAIPPKVEIIEIVSETPEAAFTKAEAEVELTPAPSIDRHFEQEILVKTDWNGEDLKKVRLYRDLSYDELTDITKINPWYIAAIENMDFKNLPVAVFVRGYVVQIAKAMGLKEKIVAESYMKLYKQKLEN